MFVRSCVYANITFLLYKYIKAIIHKRIMWINMVIFVVVFFWAYIGRERHCTRETHIFNEKQHSLLLNIFRIKVLKINIATPCFLNIRIHKL